MSNFIQTSVGNGVAVVSLRRVTELGLGPDIRSELLDALREADATPDVAAIVLTSELGAYAADLPLAERLKGQQNPSLMQLCDWVQSSRKPVVAALRGQVFDAGFELALAAQARVAHQNVRVRLARLRAGRLPSPQALARLAANLGARDSQHLLQSGESYSVTHPMVAPLFDTIVGQNAVGIAADLARSLAQGPEHAAPMPGADDPLAYQEAIRTARALSSNTPEAIALVDTLEAAQLLPTPALIAFADERDEALAKSAQTAAKTYETCCKEVLLTPSGSAPAAKRITLVGTGSLARNLTLAALSAGIGVDIVSPEGGDFEGFKTKISNAYRELVQRQKLSEARAQNTFAGLAHLPELGGPIQHEIVIECAAQSVEQIGTLAKDLRHRIGDNVPLLLTTGMRHGAGRFSEFLGPNTAGGHFHFAPASERYVEIAFDPNTFENLTLRERFAATFKQIGLPVISQKARDGLASARLLTAYLQGAEECLALGASFTQLDRALAGGEFGSRLPAFSYWNAEGFRLQPFRISTFFTQDNAASGPAALSAYLLRAGFEGRASSSALGPDTGQALPAAEDALTEWRDSLKVLGAVSPRTLSDAEICQIVDAALYCCGAQLLEQGYIRTPWELDHLACATLEAKPGYGGPFHRVQTTGLLQQRKFLRSFNALRPAFFKMPSALTEMIKSGEHFAQPALQSSARL